MNVTLFLSIALLVGGTVVGDVDGYLQRSATAEFAGEQLVSCETPEGPRSAVFNLAQVDGAVVAWNTGDGAMVAVSPGVSITFSDGQAKAAVVEGTVSADPGPYTVGSTRATTYLGREAEEVTLMRDGQDRVLLTVDAETEAILRTVTLDGQGSPYCDRRLLSFTTVLDDVPVVAEAGGSPSAPIDDVPAVLAQDVQGFELVDTYSIADGTLSYYSDGFFSAGVVVTRRPISFPESEPPTHLETSHGTYLRSFQVGSVTVSWQAGSDNIAVIGDLPPDLVDAFLEELPPPSQPGFFGRIWQRLFG